MTSKWRRPKRKEELEVRESRGLWRAISLTNFRMGIGALLLGMVVLIGAPSFVLATSGACSWHGGVDCAAGPQADGTVICNDGWLGSSVLYSSMAECAGYESYNLPQPDCPLFSSYDDATGQCVCFYGYTSNGYGGCESDLTYCQNLEGYNATYNAGTNSCECEYGSVYSGGQCVNGSLYCSSRFGVGAEFSYATQRCECGAGYTPNYNGSACVSDYFNY